MKNQNESTHDFFSISTWFVILVMILGFVLDLIDLNFKNFAFFAFLWFSKGWFSYLSKRKI